MIHLKLRTEGSFGQTFAPLDRVIKRLKEIGCSAAGIVDNNTWYHVPFFNKCKAAGIQPLLGIEIVVHDDDDISPAMWFLAKNTDGLSELYEFASRAHRQPQSTKRGSIPRLYYDDVLAISDNVFVFAGEVLDEKLIEQRKPIIDLNPSSRVLNNRKKALAKKFGLTVIDTADNAFVYENDSDTFELISRGSLKASPQWITELQTGEAENEIAAACSSMELPKAPMVRAEGDLEALCRAGIKFRKMEEMWNDEYEQRLIYELDLIRSKDFESYFIIVADMVGFAKQHMLVGPSRGSAAGSLVCYLARITEINPIPPKLYFERFIDVSRTDLPDIDLDFPDDKRHMVFEYMAEKYGSTNTAHIGTISQFKPKSALIQVCKALGIPPSATAGVKAAMIERSSADSRANNCLEDTLKTTDPGKVLLSMYPQVEMATLLEGHASHTGVHAAGLLVCNEPITKFATVDANGIAHVEKGAAESLGLLKIDVLGLRTLGILEDSGVPIDWYNLPFNDKETYDVFNNQRLCGIFQFEGNALRAISGDIDFRSIIEIDAVTALARPGPFGGGVTEEYVKRKQGKPYEAVHPLVERHMEETFGLPVYQEQTLAIVREIGKFDWKETSTIRKAMSKRMGKEFFDTYWEKFKAGAASQGIDEEKARATWEMINSMGAWQMNKAHTYSYAVISYWTAYLKAHHPLEFAAANLRSAKSEDSAIELLREMVREGVEYVPFDIELSEENWCVKNGKLYGGFMALKGIGESGAAKYVAARDAGKLTSKDREKIASCENIFDNIFPFSTKYSSIYENPARHGISCDKMWSIGDINSISNIKHGDELVFMGEVIYKNSRDANEEINVKKRGGEVLKGQTQFADMRLRDDTGTIGARIGRFDWFQMKNGSAGGKEFIESVPVGAHLLVRAKFFNDIRFAFISKWKVLE